MQLPALVRSADSEHERFFIFISIISPLHHNHPGALQAGSLHLSLALSCQQSVLQVFPPRSYKTCKQPSAACRHCPDSLPSSLRWETGTASFEAISGIRCRAFRSLFYGFFERSQPVAPDLPSHTPRAAIEYLATLGLRAGREAEGLRARLEEGYRAVREHEEDISRCRPPLQFS